MGRELYDTQPDFRAALDRCDAVLKPLLGQSLISALYPQEDSLESATRLLSQTAWTQPALFALEFALSELWRSWGVTPSVVMGHSVGEYVAACVAGVFSVEDGLTLIAERSRLMQQLPEGGVMAALAVEEPVVLAALEQVAGPIAIAAINAPNQTVVSGSRDAVRALIERLGGEAVKATYLPVSHAFHSPLMEPMLDAFEQFARRFTYKAPTIPVVSNVTGTAIEAPQTLDASYWRRHARAAVRFHDSLATARALGCQVFLEVGPQPTLVALATRSGARDVTGVASLRRGRDDWQQMLSALGSLFVAGVAVDWRGFDRHAARRKVHLPTYPFERQRFWFTPAAPRATSTTSKRVGHPLLGARVTSPRLTDVIFERELEAETLLSVSQHKIFGQVVVPAAAYLEMAIAAGRIALRNEAISVRGLTIHRPLGLGAESRTIQTIVVAGDRDREVQIYSRDAAAHNENGGWTLHASGRLVPSADGAASASVPASPSSALDVTAYYDRLRESGVEYGPAFQGLVEISRGENVATGTIVIPEIVATESSDYYLHPALLDAAFQLLGVALPSSPGDDTVYMPVEVGEYSLSGRPVSRMVCTAAVAKLPAGSSETFTGEVTLKSEDGLLIGTIAGLQFKRASRAALHRGVAHAVDQWMYENRVAVPACAAALDNPWWPLAGVCRCTWRGRRSRARAGRARRLLPSGETRSRLR